MSGVTTQKRIDLKGPSAASTSVVLPAGATFPVQSKLHELTPGRRQRFYIDVILSLTAGAGGAAGGHGQKLFTFPEGFVLLEAVICSFSLTTQAGASGASVVYAIGSAQAAQDATLTGTEADLIASQTLGDGTIAAATAEVESTIKVPAVAAAGVDASAAAKDFYLNVAGTWTHASANPITARLTGNIDVLWKYLGDD